MITVINFSHPLNPEAETAVKRYGNGEAEIRTIKVQVDRTKPLKPQVDALFAEALNVVADIYGSPHAGSAANVDCIILPGLSDVAVLLAAKFPTANIISMNAVPNALPPKYMPSELLRR